MKRLTNLLLLAAVLLAGVAVAQTGTLPDDARFDQPVEFSTSNGGEQLSTMVSALARSVGLTPIVDGVPDTLIQYDIGDPKPFRQVWDLVLTLNDLDFILQENDVVVVGTEASLAPLVARQAPAAPEVAEQEPGADVVQRFYRVIAEPDQIVTLLSRAVAGIEVEALPGVGSVVVLGTEEQHAQVREVLNEFDTAAEEVELEQRVYALSNADAEELAEVLQSSDVVVSGATSADGEGASERGFTVVADVRTNSLIVTASLPVQRSIAELIPELDVPQQQVNVQVRIQEVNRRTVDSFGINLGAASGNFAASVLGTGLQFIFDAQQAVSQLNISAVLDALESQGLSTRVDDTTLTVLNNATGRMQSGGRIEITYPSGDGEIATRTIEFGVIIEVTPRVSSDGTVVLDVSAEVSDVLVPLSEGGIPERIDFSTREVSSTVTLRQGQTVLLAGLLQNSFSQTQRRVPILGDIPIIGALFGSTEVEDDNTELLLVVNADVID
ncbi:MAG: secretin N-terminal domain-containing protein [Trueperaceae bacterium]|nr:secretin N-terminal domain-containing protein [Trueperaceae bacterium]